MTQPDRRHLRRARLALAVVVAAALAAPAVVPRRAYLSAAESDGVSLPGSAAGQRVYRRLGPQAALVSFALMILQGDRRSAAGFPDYLGERRPVRRLLGRGAVVVQRYGRGRALLLHRQSAGARSGGETHRPRGAAQCRRLFHPLWPADDPRSAACCRLSRLTRSAMPPD